LISHLPSRLGQASLALFSSLFHAVLITSGAYLIPSYSALDIATSFISQVSHFILRLHFRAGFATIIMSAASMRQQSTNASTPQTNIEVLFRHRPFTSRQRSTPRQLTYRLPPTVDYLGFSRLMSEIAR
jgi:hypothetical protein